MPLHPGMSGGPILNARHEVVGTNVATSWRSNVLSFGVPVTAVHALLAAPRILTSPDALRVETHRQLAALDVRARERAVAPILAGAGALISVGGAQTPRCSYAHVHHPDLGHFALVATSESRPHEAVFVALHGRGVGLLGFTRLSERVLAETRFAEAKS